MANPFLQFSRQFPNQPITPTMQDYYGNIGQLSTPPVIAEPVAPPILPPSPPAINLPIGTPTTQSARPSRPWERPMRPARRSTIGDLARMMNDMVRSPII